MKKYIIIIVIFILAVAGILFYGLMSYSNSIKAVSSNNELREFVVKTGQNYYNIAHKLKESNLIKSELGYKIYLKLNPPKKNLEAGTYYLSESMTVHDIIKTFGNGSAYDKSNEITITINEGLTIPKIAKKIESTTGIKEDEIMSLISDETYLNSLISKYWFLTDDIKNKDIYYSLEGYLYPETYQIRKNATAKEVIEMLLDYESKMLEKYKDDFSNNKLSIHEIITLASVVEIESKTPEDRKGVAGVFFNRLNSGMNLGSDVTTYYGAKVDMRERDLYDTEIKELNPYNTRHSAMAGKLPVGPISNPSITSIEAVLNPTQSDYYYFVSDKTGKIYFSKNLNEHNSIIADLKAKNMWYEYE